MKRMRFWALGAVLVLAAYIVLFASPHYEPGDDAVLLYSLLAGESYSLYTHTLLHWLLLGLTALFPRVAWLSVWQMAMLALGAYASLTGGMRLAKRLGLPVWTGFSLAFACCAVMVIPCANNVTYTLTGAVLGMAAVWQLLGRGKAGVSIIYLLLGFSLRDASVLPSLCFWLGGLICLWKLESMPFRKLLRWAGLCVLSLALMAGLHEAQAAWCGEREYADWQQSRIAAMDYGDVSAYEGWTESERALVREWCFLDEGVTKEALDAVPHREPSLDTLRLLLAKNRWMYWMTALVCGLLLCGGLGRGWWPRLAALCGIGLCAAMLLALAWRGRLPARAAATVLFPAFAFGVYLLLRLPKRRRMAAMLAVCVLLLPCLRQAWVQSHQPKPAARETVFTRLDEYAVEHPDELIIGDGSIGRDPTLFPVRAQGFANNLLLCWGGWNTHSEGYRAVMASFGYEHQSFRIASFLDPAIRLAVKQGAAPSANLMAVMEEQTGTSVEAVLCYEGDGFAVYRFETRNPLAG